MKAVTNGIKVPEQDSKTSTLTSKDASSIESKPQADHGPKSARPRDTSPIDSIVDDINIEPPESKHEEPSGHKNCSWKGWAELENDPIIFSTLLREWGVKGVEVREVIPLDAVFDTPVASMLGLIFLSRYVAPEEANKTSNPPANLWFSNQTSSFSCATVALMNIMNNRSDVHLGSDLKAFRDLTISLRPGARGLALDGFDVARDVHNSFSTENDRMNVDQRLKDDAKAAAVKKRVARMTKGRKGNRSKNWDGDEESGFHFIAYVPAYEEVWKMDGLERLPTSLGSLADADNWVAMVIPHLEAQWQSAAINELEFSLLSVVAEISGADAADEEEKMQRKREDWGPMLAQFIRLHAEKGGLADKLT